MTRDLKARIMKWAEFYDSEHEFTHMRELIEALAELVEPLQVYAQYRNFSQEHGYDVGDLARNVLDKLERLLGGGEG